MRPTLLAATGFATFIPLSLVLGHGSGIISGRNMDPPNLATSFPSCGTTGCHNAFPNFNVNLALEGATSIAANASVAMKATVSGANMTSTRGGFTLEASSGAFKAGTTTRAATTNRGRAAITHQNSLNRTWSFTWDAPATPGLVQMFAVGNAVNGDGRSTGDAWGWHGINPSVPGGAYRLFVNGANVTSTGTSCPGADGFRPVLGMATAPAVNKTFQTEAYNLPPATASLGILGVSNTFFGALPLPFPLQVIGGGTCVLRVSLDITQVAVTSGFGPGEGVAKITWAIPNDATLRGLKLYFQQMTVDSKANAFGFSFSNALNTSIQ